MKKIDLRVGYVVRTALLNLCYEHSKTTRMAEETYTQVSNRVENPIRLHSMHHVLWGDGGLTSS